MCTRDKGLLINMAQSNNTVNFLIHDANGQPQFIKVVQAQAASPAKPISVVGSAITNQAVKAIIKTQDSSQSGTTVLTSGHQVLRTIGIPATKNATGQRTTHVVTIPFQQASGTSSGTPTKLLVSTPHKVATTVSGSPGGEHLLLPRNAKIITSSPGIRQTTLIKTEHKNVTSTPLTIDGNKSTFQFTGGKLAVGGSQKHFISPILDHSRKRKEPDTEYHSEYSGSSSSHHIAPGGKRRKSEKGGKGLRHFSKKVCEKVRRKGTTSYNEVADELVAEFTNPVNCFSTSADQYDQKNIRRRVYDALNVLMAMNIISKEKKEIRWLGLPTNSQQECIALEKDKLKRAASISQKMQQLQDLILQQIAFKNLVERNRAAEARHGPPGPNSSIQLPFILVHTAKDTTIDCSISSDKREYLFNFDNKFEIHDDMEVLKRMGLALGLEKGNCSDDDLDRARSMVPPALESYVTPIAEGNIIVTEDDMEVGNSVGQISQHHAAEETLRADSISPSFGDYSEEESEGSSDLEVN
ncbi:hypothetical protein B566_EDAN015626 [Ephemera danica]|nr:hypothetical protein B566_EDAN015626 [Ephemera danica]